MTILGIDPGLRLTGYACLHQADGRPAIVEAGVFRLGKSAAKDAASISARLAELERDMNDLLGRTRPAVVAVEQLFAHHKHPATAIIMAHARGVILLCVRRAGATLVELRPNEVKKSIAGFGHAAKSGMQRSVQAYFGLEKPPSPPDVADAIAIALCALLRSGGPAMPARSGPRSRRRTLPRGVDIINP